MKGIGILFLILSVLTVPMALLGAGSNAYDMKMGFDFFIDILMRFLYVGIPLGLLISSIGLLMKKNWGRVFAIATSLMLFFLSFGYGIAGLGYKGNFTFCLICFISAFLFGAIILYLKKKILIKNKHL